MNAPAKIEADNLAIWNALATTDPKQTKGFKRSGGFTGTAIKPIWTVKRLTEQFGPVGVGWGMNKPAFDVVHATEGEVAVYCTVECWHTTPENTFYGVGGDKAVGKNKYGLSVDDEAFKKAFTDAVGNAFKFVGVAADIHMGLFDDNKYVQHAANEWAEREAAGDGAGNGAVGPGGEGAFPPGPAKNITALKTMQRELWREIEGCGDAGELEPLLAIPDNKAIMKQLSSLEKPDHRALWFGDGGDNPGLQGLIRSKRKLFDMQANTGGAYQEEPAE
jgi:hypothetical protein